MSNERNVLIVIDPSQNSHPALARALMMAKQGKSNDDIKYVFLLTATPEQSKSSSYFACSDEWIRDQIYDRMADTDIPFSILVAWSNDWKDVVLEASRVHQAIMTIVPFYGQTQEFMLSDEKWKLLRNAPNPILIASQLEPRPTRRILCSIKSQDERYAERNQNVVTTAQQMADIFDLESHVVNAYTDSMEYPDRAQIANTTSIDNDRIHVKLGEPQDVICDTAQEIDAALVLIGSQRRTGLQGVLRGNTVEKIIERVDSDVLMI